MSPDERLIRLARVHVMAARLDAAMAGALVEHAHLTQAKLARLIDTDRATVCKMLKGKDGLLSTWLAAFDAAGYELVAQPKDVAQK